MEIKVIKKKYVKIIRIAKIRAGVIAVSLGIISNFIFTILSNSSNTFSDGIAFAMIIGIIFYAGIYLLNRRMIEKEKIEELVSNYYNELLEIERLEIQTKKELLLNNFVIENNLVFNPKHPKYKVNLSFNKDLILDNFQKRLKLKAFLMNPTSLDSEKYSEFQFTGYLSKINGESCTITDVYSIDNRFQFPVLEIKAQSSFFIKHIPHEKDKVLFNLKMNSKGNIENVTQIAFTIITEYIQKKKS